MTLSIRLVVAFSATLFAGRTAFAQLPTTAPPPHLAIDEFVKEYKRLDLPLPPANAELVRVKVVRFGYEPDELAFRIPSTTPGDNPKYLVGSTYETLVTSAEPVKPGPDILKGVEPVHASDMLCLAVQCRVHGLNEFAKLLYARAQEAIVNPVPSRLGITIIGGGGSTRVNGWQLRRGDTSAMKELRSVASEYWIEQITAPDSDRKQVLRHLKELEPGMTDELRALELTVVPRKSKSGTVESLIDDLTDYWPSGEPGSAPLDEKSRGEGAYRKLVEMGFDAVPALLEHLEDERFTRSTYYAFALYSKTPSGWTLRVQVRHLVGQLLNDLSGREFSDKAYPQLVDAEKARVWWEKARKEGEEKWLVAHAVPEFVGYGDANSVLFRALGAKYPARLGEFYRTVLVKHPQRGSSVLADEVAASKLPRAEKLALLVEGAEHKNMVHRNAALTVLTRLDPPLFRKHLLATLKKLPPNFERTRSSDPLLDLVNLVFWKADDPACLDALVTFAKQSAVTDRLAIIRSQLNWSTPEWDKKKRRALLRFLLEFMSDETATTIVGPHGEERPGGPVRDVATEVLAGQLGLQAQYSLDSGGLERLLFRAIVAKLAAKELAELEK
jgi:hypothetical protein